MVFLWSIGHTRLPWQLCKFPRVKGIPSHPQLPHTHCIAMASSTTPTLVCLRIVVGLSKSLYKAVLLLKIPTPTMHPSFPLPSHPQTVSLPGHHPCQSAFVSRDSRAFSLHRRPVDSRFHGRTFLLGRFFLRCRGVAGILVTSNIALSPFSLPNPPSESLLITKLTVFTLLCTNFSKHFPPMLLN